jgi:hypothetical protein
LADHDPASQPKGPHPQTKLGIMNRPQFGQLDALIFDMDGVLINSEPLHERAKREALLGKSVLHFRYQGLRTWPKGY